MTSDQKTCLPQTSTSALAIHVLMEVNAMIKLEDTYVNVLQVMREQTVKMVGKNKEQKSTALSVSILCGRSQRRSCQMSK